VRFGSDRPLQGSRRAGVARGRGRPAGRRRGGTEPPFAGRLLFGCDVRPLMPRRCRRGADRPCRPLPFGCDVVVDVWLCRGRRWRPGADRSLPGGRCSGMAYGSPSPDRWSPGAWLVRLRAAAVCRWARDGRPAHPGPHRGPCR